MDRVVQKREQVSIVSGALSVLRVFIGSVALAGLFAVGAVASPIEVVIVDAGHGDDDIGAIGPNGSQEKDVVLGLAKEFGKKLEEAGIRVIYTRNDDSFVSLAERAEVANMTKDADLFISLHANASQDATVRGPETYFLSQEASDEEAREVARAENDFGRLRSAEDAGPELGALLASMMQTRYLEDSRDVAMAIQLELEKLPGKSRGVKQAPFVVLSNVNMPAVLVEVGFLTNRDEERELRRSSHRARIVSAIVRAIKSTALAGEKRPGREEPQVSEGR